MWLYVCEITQKSLKEFFSISADVGHFYKVSTLRSYLEKSFSSIFICLQSDSQESKFTGASSQIAF